MDCRSQAHRARRCLRARALGTLGVLASAAAPIHAQSTGPQRIVYPNTSLTACPQGQSLDYFFYDQDIPAWRGASWCGAAQANNDWANATDTLLWRLPYLVDSCTAGVSWVYSHSRPNTSRYVSPPIRDISLVCSTGGSQAPSTTFPPEGCAAGAGGFYQCIGSKPFEDATPASVTSPRQNDGQQQPDVPDEEVIVDPDEPDPNGATCRAGLAQPANAAGDPIHAGTGNVYEREMDYADAGALSFVRHYNSQLRTWTHKPVVDMSHRFPGQTWDAETGTAYNLLRDLYDPFTGRYRQFDPIRLRGGWNGFIYVNGSPLTSSDPLGLDPFDLQFNRAAGTLWITPPGSDTAQGFAAANNAQSNSRGPWEPGSYKFEYSKAHGDDAPNSPYGSNGNAIFNVPGCEGCGIHSGRETKPDGLGRTGVSHATLGCIRTTDDATKLLQELIRQGHTPTLRVTN